MTHNIMLTVGIGPESSVVLGVIADGNVVCNIVMSKQQVQDHITVLARHAALLPDAKPVDISGLN